MPQCSVCHGQVTEKANFCQECGSQLKTIASDHAWIISMQERIKAVRRNDATFNIVGAIGLLIAVVIPFIMHYFLLYTMDTLSWTLTGVGIVLALGSLFGLWWDDRKIKDMIEELEMGPLAEDEYQDDTEEPE
jgi:cobalamin biosynthesis protein CobD/CbiB